MTQKRKTHAETFKARGAVEAIKGVRTLSELSAAHGVHSTVMAHWKGRGWTGRRRCSGGAWPARAAARLVPVEALRYE